MKPTRHFLSRAQPRLWAYPALPGGVCRRTLLLIALLASQAQAQTPPTASASTGLATPSQVPLLNPARTLIKPNLMVTVDDSYSMGLEYMPDKAMRVGPWRLDTTPAKSRSIAFHPGDILNGKVQSGAGFFEAVPGSMSWTQRFMRSPDTNPVYYNPGVTYRPWLKADGSRFPPAKIDAAVFDPIEPPAATADLKTTVDPLNARWCTGVNDPIFCDMTDRKYVPGLYYRLARQNGEYLDPTDPANFIEYDANAEVGPAAGPGRTDCAKSECTLAEEQQNFANWFVYYRTRLNFAKAIIGETLGGFGDQVRIGWGRLSASKTEVDGLGPFDYIEAGVRDWTPERKRAFLDWLYRMNLGLSTPIIAATQEVGRYYMQADDRGPWGDSPGEVSGNAQASCRRAYHLVITDGYASANGAKIEGNRDGSPGPVIPLADGRTWRYLPQRPYMDTFSERLADTAIHYWYQDLRPDLPNKVVPIPGNEASWQSVSQFIVGFGGSGVLDPQTDLPDLISGKKTWPGVIGVDDLWHAALNSRGGYFNVTSPAALRSALTDALNTMAPTGMQSQAGVVTASANAEAGNLRYQATYRSSDWSGDLLALSLDPGTAASPVQWSAERALPPWSERRLFIWDEGAQTVGAVPFIWSGLSEPLQAALGKDPGAPLVDYIRGDRSQEGGPGRRARGGLLGDFINSTPVVADATREPKLDLLPGVGDTYDAYVREVKGRRPRVIYVGGNDGMLHAFRDGAGPDGAPPGREIFAYLPRAVAGQLRNLIDPNYVLAADGHRYFVDGPLRLADVHVPPPGGGAPAWHNYLFASTGAGPAAVFALDVTDPAALGAASVRWELRGQTDDRLGHVLAPVTTGMLPNGTWVALFGNGWGSASKQAHLFIVELDSGLVHAIRLPKPSDAQAADGLGGVALRKDAQGQIVSAYAGDLSGRLWRFDFSSTNPDFFSVAHDAGPLFQAEAGQSIVQAPLVAMKGDSVFVSFGTGRLVTKDDASDVAGQAVYVVEDRPGETLPLPLAPAQLAERTLSVLPAPASATASSADQKGQVFYAVSDATIDPRTQRGWRLTLSGQDVPPGLRVLQPLQSFAPKGPADMFLVAAEAPGRVPDPCEPIPGVGVNLLLRALSASTPETPMLDTNSDGVVGQGDDRQAVGYGTLADGVDAILHVPEPAGSGAPNTGGPGNSGSPSSAGSCGNNLSLVSSTGSMAACISSGPLVLRDRVWRRILNPPF